MFCRKHCSEGSQLTNELLLDLALRITFGCLFVFINCILIMPKSQHVAGKAMLLIITRALK